MPDKQRSLTPSSCNDRSALFHGASPPESSMSSFVDTTCQHTSGLLHAQGFLSRFEFFFFRFSFCVFTLLSAFFSLSPFCSSSSLSPLWLQRGPQSGARQRRLSGERTLLRSLNFEHGLVPAALLLFPYFLEFVFSLFLWPSGFVSSTVCSTSGGFSPIFYRPTLLSRVTPQLAVGGIFILFLPSSSTRNSKLLFRYSSLFTFSCRGKGLDTIRGSHSYIISALLLALYVLLPIAKRSVPRKCPNRFFESPLRRGISANETFKLTRICTSSSVVRAISSRAVRGVSSSSLARSLPCSLPDQNTFLLYYQSPCIS